MEDAVLHSGDFKRTSSLGTSSDRGIYILGAMLGVCAGVLDVKVGDLLLTALFVLAATMLLGALRPQRPWRWTLLVAVFVPLVQLAAYALLTEKPYRAQIYESFLGFLTGIAGAYAGATGRRGVATLFEK
ncbi:MAG: hypothetical protein ACRD23_11815 [Terriglobales bacterium]